MNDPYDAKQSPPPAQGVFPQKGVDQTTTMPEGRGQPSEVSGSMRWPREMEGTSRFQQSDVVELEAPQVDPGSGRRAR